MLCNVMLRGATMREARSKASQEDYERYRAMTCIALHCVALPALRRIALQRSISHCSALYRNAALYIALHSIELHPYIALHRTASCYVALHCIALHRSICGVLHCTSLCCIVLYNAALPFVSLRCIPLYRAALHRIILHRIISQ
jgi:hypothetical protein